jgi:hypothetical protein
MDRFGYFQASGSNVNTTLLTHDGILHSVLVGQCTTLGTFQIIDGSGSVGPVIATVNVPATNLLPAAMVLDVRVNSGLSVKFGAFQGVVTLIYK